MSGPRSFPAFGRNAPAHSRGAPTRRGGCSHLSGPKNLVGLAALCASPASGVATSLTGGVSLDGGEATLCRGPLRCACASSMDWWCSFARPAVAFTRLARDDARLGFHVDNGVCDLRRLQMAHVVGGTCQAEAR